MAQSDLKPILNAWMFDETIKKMRNITTQALNKNPCCLTKEEFLEAFIMPEHVKPLFDVYELIGGQLATDATIRLSSNNNLPGSDDNVLIATMHFMSQPAFLVPSYVKTSLQADTPAGKRVAAWALERRRIGLLVADAIDALEWLNLRCGNARALSLMFPVLPAIMIRAGNKEETNAITIKGRALTKTRAIGHIPKLQQAVVERIAEASALLQALIMTENAVVDLPAETCVTLQGISSPAEIQIFNRPHIITENVFVRSFV